MRDFMEFCLQVLSELVFVLFDLSLGDYSYGSFLVVCLLVSALVGALAIHFNPKVPSGSDRPPRISSHDDGSGE
ncbi:MAG: hypothetical protein HFG75_07075 [Hungatella sp.]|nr:hypothetical protein [Hungatella sp.]